MTNELFPAQRAAALKDDSEFSHVLYHDDMSGREVRERRGGVAVIARGMGKYLDVDASESGGSNLLCPIENAESSACREFRFRAVVTPVSFDNELPFAGFCGIFACYRNASDYVALLLDRHYQVKLVRRSARGLELLASSPLEFCFGQSLTLTLTIKNSKIVGEARPYAGVTVIRSPDTVEDFDPTGSCGFISNAKARFGPHTLECPAAEFERIKNLPCKVENAAAQTPDMKLDRNVALQNRVTGPNLLFADLNRDGKPEILVGQSSKKIATTLSLTRLTCLTALDLDGNILWQAGVHDPEATHETAAYKGRLPFEIHDIYGDGRPAVVCVFGYDLQIRDGKTGRILMSGSTPMTAPIDTDFKTLTNAFGANWGDETLNMDVASIAFCDTQGSGGKREIIVKDDYHNLAVLDTQSEPVLHAIFQHRGNLGGKPWSGDIDDDGKDEILCGYSLLDHDGTLIASLPLGGHARSVTVIDDEPEPGTRRRTVFICAGNEGLIVLDADALRSGKYSLAS